MNLFPPVPLTQVSPFPKTLLLWSPVVRRSRPLHRKGEDGSFVDRVRTRVPRVIYVSELLIRGENNT